MFFQHQSVAIVKGAGMVMKAVIEVRLIFNSCILKKKSASIFEFITALRPLCAF